MRKRGKSKKCIIIKRGEAMQRQRLITWKISLEGKPLTICSEQFAQEWIVYTMDKFCFVNEFAFVAH